MEHGFSWVQQIPGLNLLEPHTATALLVMVGLLLLALRARQQLAGAGNQVVPDEGFSARNIGEVVTEFITNLSESVIGHDGPKYVPLFASLFVFILGSNLMGLIPGFTPPTDNFNVTLALGVVAFVAYNYYGLQAHGIAYLKQFMGPLLLLAPLMIVVELFSHLFRPASLAIRLFTRHGIGFTYQRAGRTSDFLELPNQTRAQSTVGVYYTFLGTGGFGAVR